MKGNWNDLERCSEKEEKKSCNEKDRRPSVDKSRAWKRDLELIRIRLGGSSASTKRYRDKGDWFCPNNGRPRPMSTVHWALFRFLRTTIIYAAQLSAPDLVLPFQNRRDKSTIFQLTILSFFFYFERSQQKLIQFRFSKFVLMNGNMMVFEIVIFFGIGKDEICFGLDEKRVGKRPIITSLTRMSCSESSKAHRRRCITRAMRHDKLN